MASNLQTRMLCCFVRCFPSSRVSAYIDPDGRCEDDGVELADKDAVLLCEVLPELESVCVIDPDGRCEDDGVELARQGCCAAL